MEFIENIFKRFAGFFIDSKHALTKRFSVAIIVLGLAFVIDDQIGFTYYYAAKQKIEHSERLTAIMKSDSIDPRVRQELLNLQLTVLRRKGIVSHLWVLTKSAISSSNSQINSTKPNNIIISNQRNIILHVLSSNWFLIIISVIGIFGIAIQPKIGGYEVAGVVLLIFIIAVVALGFSYLFSLIPILFDNPVYNYVLNSFLHLIIILIIARFISKITKK